MNGWRFLWMGLLIGLGCMRLPAQCAVSLGADTALCAASHTLVPSLSISTFEDSLEIIYDASQGQSGLGGAAKVYLHSAAEMVPFGGWQNTVGNWGQDDGVGQMTSIGTDLWRIRLVPHLYYGFPANVVPNGLFMVFRNADGSATGKDAAGNDIWADMGQDPPQSAFGGVQFAWKRDALDSLHWSDGSNGMDLTVNGAGTYWVTMTDTSGCMAADTVFVDLAAIPIVDLGQPAICDGIPVTLDAGGGFAQYNWSTGATTQAITLGTPGLVTVTVTNSAGCMGSDVVNVPTASAPAAAFTPTVLGFTVQLVDGSTGGGTYSWDFDSNGTTDATTPGTTSHAYSTARTYTVTLIVENFCGADTFSQVVTIGGVGLSDAFSSAFSLYPNPAQDRITLEMNLPKGTALHWAVIDGQGRTLQSGNAGRVAGFFRKELDIQALPPGIYHLALWRGADLQTRSFIKQ